MNLKLKIKTDINSALKKQAKKKLEVLRFLDAQIKNKEIEQGRRELTDQEILQLINQQIKKVRESLALFKRGGRKDLADKAQIELEILKSYLPVQLSDQDLEIEIDRLLKENPETDQPGKIIGLAVKKLAGRADNQRVAQLVTQKFRQKEG